MWIWFLKIIIYLNCLRCILVLAKSIGLWARLVSFLFPISGWGRLQLCYLAQCLAGACNVWKEMRRKFHPIIDNANLMNHSLIVSCFFSQTSYSTLVYRISLVPPFVIDRTFTITRVVGVSLPLTGFPWGFLLTWFVVTTWRTEDRGLICAHWLTVVNNTIAIWTRFCLGLCHLGRFALLDSFLERLTASMEHKYTGRALQSVWLQVS